MQVRDRLGKMIDVPREIVDAANATFNWMSAHGVEELCSLRHPAAGYSRGFQTVVKNSLDPD